MGTSTKTEHSAVQIQPAFLFVTCQVGAERAVKSELARLWPSFHFAYSRSGFLTFKLPAEHDLADDFDLKSVFARAMAFHSARRAPPSSTIALGKSGNSRPACVATRCMSGSAIRPRPALTASSPTSPRRRSRPKQRFAGGRQLTPRDVHSPPWPSRDSSCSIASSSSPPSGGSAITGPAATNRATPAGCEIALPAGAVSRAYLKMEEALAWSALPIERGQEFVEIGCAPGGASQALLAHGLKVIGIDPAEVDPCVLAAKNFTHIRKRGVDVRRREFRHVNWLAADMNVAPQYTLDTVEAIVTHSAVNIRGLLLTLKLLDWTLAEEIPAYLERIRSWGYRDVRARQLAHDRQEICIAAVRPARRPRRRGIASRRATGISKPAKPATRRKKEKP